RFASVSIRVRLVLPPSPSDGVAVSSVRSEARLILRSAVRALGEDATATAAASRPDSPPPAPNRIDLRLPFALKESVTFAFTRQSSEHRTAGCSPTRPRRRRL